MKKVIGLALLFGLGLLLVSGCQTASTPTTVPAASAAQGLGILATEGLGIDNSILGVFPYAVLSASSVRASAPSTPTYSGGWWSCTNSYTKVFTVDATTYTFSHSYDYNFRVWDDASIEVITKAVLDACTRSNISKISLYSTDTFSSNGVSATMKFGASKDDPLTFNGYGTGSFKIDGPMSYSSNYGGTDYTISLDYVNVTLATNGIPNGAINFSISVGGSTTYAGTITYNSIAGTATIEFTSGATGTYTVDLSTGIVTPAST